MKDSFMRDINYLRISVTDRCNLRCVYCMPEEGVPSLSHGEILTYEEIIKIAKAAKKLGIEHIRLTGGEPLVRKNLAFLIKELKLIGISDISLTTNAILLPSLSKVLKRSGLDRVNISLDTLNPERFSRITRIGDLDEALAGVESAIESGLNPVKINNVVTSENFDEIPQIASLVLTKPIHVRFIELMPMGPESFLSTDNSIPIQAVIAEVEKLGRLEPVNALAVQGAGPAKTFRLSESNGTIGFIGAVSHPFCGSCNRLRLTADGKLRPCLANNIEVDLMPILRPASTDKSLPKQCTDLAIEQAFKLAADLKPKGHDFQGHHVYSRRMCQIGG